MSSPAAQGSYSVSADDDAEVREEKICKRCRGTGQIVLHGQDTDCEDCEGWGSFLI